MLGQARAEPCLPLWGWDSALLCYREKLHRAGAGSIVQAVQECLWLPISTLHCAWD